MPVCTVHYKVNNTSVYPAELIRGYDDALNAFAVQYKGTELGSGYGFGERDVVFEFKLKFHMKKFMKAVKNFAWVDSITVLHERSVCD